MVIRAEEAGDATNIENLHDQAFGPGRFAKTAYRLREGRKSVGSLSLVALDGTRLVGSIRFMAITIGAASGALLLGPLAVFEGYSGHRCGLRLMRMGLDQARAEGFEIVVLVGDLAYYERVGFVPIPPQQISMPGPVDMRRLLACELREGVLPKFAGMISS